MIYSSLKTFAKNFIQNKQRPKLLLLTFLAKFLTEKKISSEKFRDCEANIFLQKVTKPINSEKNIKSPDNDRLAAEFYFHV